MGERDDIVVCFDCSSPLKTQEGASLLSVVEKEIICFVCAIMWEEVRFYVQL